MSSILDILKININIKCRSAQDYVLNDTFYYIGFTFKSLIKVIFRVLLPSEIS